MKLATLRKDNCTSAVVVDGDELIELESTDVGALLAGPNWREDVRHALSRGHSTRRPLAGANLSPVVPCPSKIVCVGLNYRTHITEMGRDLPAHPTLFVKCAETLIGAFDDIALPPETTQLDWEVELAVIVGSVVRRATEAQARDAVAGFAVFDDVTCRDWQFRTREWFQGKSWERTSALGPYLVTPDEVPGGLRPDLEVTLTVDGVQKQMAATDDLLFGPIDLIRYISTMVTLRPGDVIATGTPGGVGHARTPPQYLRDGQTVEAGTAELGFQRNAVLAES